MAPTAFDYKSLADGQLPASKTALYTVPAATETAIQSMHFFNTNAASNTVSLWVNSSGTDRQICAITLAQNEFMDVNDFTLEAGDIIKGMATNANQVDYSITGAEAT